MIEVRILFDPATKQITLQAPPIDKVLMLGILEITKVLVVNNPQPQPTVLDLPAKKNGNGHN